MDKLIKGLVIIAVIVLAWKHSLPWLRKQTAGPSASSAAPARSSCTGSASAASEKWGSGLHQFVNPPYDLSAWSSFRQDVESKVSSAESECGCGSESCQKTLSAMRDLRGLIADMDRAIRGGTAPPADAVQRQEAIDRQIDEAAALVRSGK